jgi:DNA-binding NarL/FixJ family response regulator
MERKIRLAIADDHSMVKMSKHFPTYIEMKVIKLCTKGKTNEEISEELSISKRTVETHIHNLLFAFELPNRNALTTHAFHCGWVS